MTKEIQADEVVCPFCYRANFTRRYKKDWICDNCKRKFTVTKGRGRTKFHIIRNWGKQ